MTTKYKSFRAATRRWAIPIALVLLPGGFLVIAWAWACKWAGPKVVPANDGLDESAQPTQGPPASTHLKFMAAMRNFSERARGEAKRTSPQSAQQPAVEPDATVVPARRSAETIL